MNESLTYLRIAERQEMHPTRLLVVSEAELDCKNARLLPIGLA